MNLHNNPFVSNHDTEEIDRRDRTPGLLKTRASSAQSSRRPKGTRVVQPAPGRPSREEPHRLQEWQRDQGGTNGNDARGGGGGGTSDGIDGGSSGSRADAGRRGTGDGDGNGGDGDGRHSLPVEHEAVHGGLKGQAE